MPRVWLRRRRPAARGCVLLASLALYGVAVLGVAVLGGIRPRERSTPAMFVGDSVPLSTSVRSSAIDGIVQPGPGVGACVDFLLYIVFNYQ